MIGYGKIAILIIICIPVTGNIRADTPKAQKGVLDLSRYDFESSGAVSLQGEWELY
jgi:hypothetical protein